MRVWSPWTDEGLVNMPSFQGEKIVFIMDESNVLDSSFLERMNTLLANGEVSESLLPIVNTGLVPVHNLVNVVKVMHLKTIYQLCHTKFHCWFCLWLVIRCHTLLRRFLVCSKGTSSPHS